MTIKPSTKLKQYINSKPIPWGQDDINAVMLSFWGLPSKTIARQTGLTTNQIQYRLKKLDLSHFRREYRNGTSLYAKIIMRDPGKHGVVSVTSRAVDRYQSKTRGESDYANKAKKKA